MFAGDSIVQIKGYRDVDIRVNSPKGPRIIRLFEVAYCEGFACNLVSLRILHRRGYWWDNKPPNNSLRDRDDAVICELVEKHGQFVIEDIPREVSRASFYLRRHRFNSWTERPTATADARTWHLRTGHPGPQALTHLVGHSEGVKIKGIPTVECDSCGCAKIKRQIYRKAREPPFKAGVRLAVDFHDYERSSLDKTSCMLVTDRYSGYIWDFYLSNRHALTVLSALEWLLKILDRQFQIKPEAIESDGELQKSKRIEDFIKGLGIRLDPSASNTQEQNGGAERSGGVIKEKSRAMRIGAKLPEFIWPEITRTAVYLYNRTPKYSFGWKSPYELFYSFLAQRDGLPSSDRKPHQQHLKVFGCKAFAMTTDAQLKRNRRQKLNPKAWIGYLVGYNSTNIYRIWNPTTNRIIATRDVIFDENQLFNGDIQQLKDDLLHVTVEELEAILRSIQTVRSEESSGPTQQEDEDLVVPLIDAVEPGVAMDATTEEERQDTVEFGDLNTQTEESGLSVENEPDQLNSNESYAPYLTPETTPSPPAACLAATIRESGHLMAQGTAVATAAGPHFSKQVPSNWTAAFNAGRLVKPLGTFGKETIRKAKLKKANPSGREYRQAAHSSTLLKLIRSGKYHRRLLPPPPKTHKDLRNHLLRLQFREAEKLHLQSY